MRQVRFRLACTPPRRVLVCRLRRVRDAVRSKPRPEAVGGSRKSAGVVDESVIGSTNETAPQGAVSFRAKVLRTLARGDRPGALRARGQMVLLKGLFLRRIVGVHGGRATVPV